MPTSENEQLYERIGDVESHRAGEHGFDSALADAQAS
jgi:hypothetical protein